MTIAKPKGTVDILPGESEKWASIEQRIRKVCKLYNFKEIRTPIFESGELFHRDQNDSSDMVTKETYDFVDRGDRNMTLRPEGTAGVVRAFIENKLYVENPVSKLFYMGPMFRYERAQRGRQRQFHQFGIEALGSASPLMDAEVIATAVAVIKEFGLSGIKVKINSIGDEESRKAYKDVLVDYFTKYEDDLCEDCKNRLHKNPLRILDCKVDHHKDYFLGAPKISTYLNESSKTHFAQVLEALKAMNIDYEVDENLVRGLDYYTHTVFEVEVDCAELGAQNVICAGGRYNNLVGQLGGPDTPACGLAFGMERLLFALESEGKKLTKEASSHLFIIAMGDKAIAKSAELLNKCRMGGLVSEMDYNNKSLKAQFKLADKNNALFTAIIGDNEIENGTVNIKNNEEKTQETVEIDKVYDYIYNYLLSKSSCSHCHH
ncbi:MAG: histidine--tRNA ligase [Acholeplasmatales bacterium]|nr:histidine--tRNA ligase [Acholeplasmatales bacterium]